MENKPNLEDELFQISTFAHTKLFTNVLKSINCAFKKKQEKMVNGNFRKSNLRFTNGRIMSLVIIAVV